VFILASISSFRSPWPALMSSWFEAILPGWHSSVRERLGCSLGWLAALSSRPWLSVTQITIQQWPQSNPINAIRSNFWHQIVSI
jgi:hypothetical protein